MLGVSEPVSEHRPHSWSSATVSETVLGVATGHVGLVGYLRVSSEAQDTRLQRDALTEAGAMKFFEDKISSRKTDRPGLAAALEYLRCGDVLAVWKLDRLGRSVKEILTLADELHDRGVGLRVLTGTLAGTYTPTGEGKFFFTIMAALDVILSSPDDQDSDLDCNVADGVFDLAA